jgi:hypothetical protein
MFKMLTHPAIIMISFVVSFFIVLLINLIIISGYGFVCRFGTLLFLKTVHNVQLIIIYIATIGTLIVDWVLNARVLSKFRWIQFIIYSDPYYFRVQILLFLPFMVFSLIVEIISLATTINYLGVVSSYKVNIALNTTIFVFLILIEIVFPLAITIYHLIKGRLNRVHSTTSLDQILENAETEELFVDFCKKEFTLEALSCYQDIRKYKKEKTNPLDIYLKYLNGGNSYMEINVSQKNSKLIFDKIKNFELDPTLFDPVEQEIQGNLYDTFGRFMCSPSYQSHVAGLKSTQEMIEKV